MGWLALAVWLGACSEGAEPPAAARTDPASDASARVVPAALPGVTWVGLLAQPLDAAGRPQGPGLWWRWDGRAAAWPLPRSGAYVLWTVHAAPTADGLP